MRSRFLKVERDCGAVIPLVAGVLTVLITMSAFTLDLGRISVKRRDLQAAADAIALDMVRNLNGGPPSAEEAQADWPVDLSASRDRNDFPTGANRTLVADAGCYDQATEIFLDTDATCPEADAVRVTAGDQIDFFFRPGSRTTDRTGIASVEDTGYATFQVGSLLASITPASNTIIGQVLGSEIAGAEVLSYNGLVGADVTLANFEAALAALTPSEGLSGDLSYRDIILASIDALAAESGNSAAITVLNGLLTGASSVDQFNIGDLISVGAAGGTPAGDAEFNVLQLLMGSVFLIDGDHAITVPAAQVNIPNVGTVGVELQMIEQPRIGGTQVGATASTGQFDLTIRPQITMSVSETVNICSLPATTRTALQSLLGNLVYNTLGFVSCLLPTSVVNRVLTLDISYSGAMQFSAAGAVVTLTAIDCFTPSIELTPQPIPLQLLNDVDFMVTGTLLDNSLGTVARIRASASASSVGGASPQTFLYSSEFGPPGRRIGSNPLGLAGLIDVDASDATVLNASLGPLVASALTSLTTNLSVALDNIDGVLLPPIIEALGITVGGADLVALSMQCILGNPNLTG